jgi:phosphoglucosamine mutase
VAAPRARLFGTDGIRGPAGVGPLAPEEVLALGRALAAAAGAGRRPVRVLVASDTRPSGDGIAAALGAGLVKGGASPHFALVLPTPAAALLVKDGGYDLGLVVTASHNPARDNGIKVLGPDGEKAPDAFERAVETALPAARRARRGAGGAREPEPVALLGARAAYVEAILGEFRGLSLRGTEVVVDAADGAAGRVAPEILRRLGAAVHPLRCGGNGARINDRCGALHPEAAGRAVRRRRARLGIALDGDGDRLVLLDEKGTPRDGDDLLAALAPRLLARRRLPGRAVVGTVMCNGGLDAHLRRHGIELVRTPVGDRHVAAAMREGGLALGAEPSGHCLVPRPGGLLTADALVAALWVLRELVRTGRPLGALLAGFRRSPRAEAAVPVARRPALEGHPALAAAVRAAEGIAGPEGRVLARYSGTEPKLRILVESPSAASARRACAALAAAARRILS